MQQHKNFRLSPIQKALEFGTTPRKRSALKACLVGASSIGFALAAPSVFAQSDSVLEEVVVTGIRASLDRAQIQILLNHFNVFQVLPLIV